MKIINSQTPNLKPYTPPTLAVLELRMKTSFLLPGSRGKHTDEALSRKDDDWDDEEIVAPNSRTYNCWDDDEEEEI